MLRGEIQKKKGTSRTVWVSVERGNWYLIAFINGKTQRIRTSRIKELKHIEEKFEYPKELNIELWWKEDLLNFGCGNIEVILEAYGDVIP